MAHAEGDAAGTKTEYARYNRFVDAPHRATPSRLVENTMPITFEYDSSRRLVSVRFFGVLSDDDLRDGQAKEYKLLRTRIRSKADHRRARRGRGTVTAEGLRNISIATPYGPGSRRALVATTDVMFGMARMFEMLREEDGDVFRVFRSMKEAMDWLDLDSGSN